MKTRMRLTPADAGRRLSLEEFEESGHGEGFRYELIGGRLDVSPLAEQTHDELSEWLVELLRAYARSCPAAINKVKAPARVFVPDAGDGVTAPEPDVAAYRGFPPGRVRPRPRWRDISPVLVAEVISPDTAQKDLVRNRRLYLRVPSIAEYWILDTREDELNPSLLVFHRRGSRWAPARRILPGGTYTTPLLPGLTLVVAPWAEGGGGGR
ncbi:MAG: Uma2 family endonuclease [Gemmataceae bacterium]